MSFTIAPHDLAKNDSGSIEIRACILWGTPAFLCMNGGSTSAENIHTHTFTAGIYNHRYIYIYIYIYIHIS